MNIENYREEIDKINIEIINLLKKRTEAAKNIGKLKKENNLPIRNEKREKEMLSNLQKVAERKGLDKTMINDIFKTIVEYTVQIEKGE